MTDRIPATLTLIGTIHRDPLGGDKLRSLLEQLSPDLLTLEMSPLALSFRQGKSGQKLQRLDMILDRLSQTLGRELGQLKSHPAVVDIRSLLDFPFEYRAAAAFAKERGIGLGLIDLSEISAIKLKRVETELITYRNLKVLVNLPPCAEKTGGEDFGSARMLISPKLDETVRQAFLQRHRGEEGIGPRDRWMAGEIRRRLEQSPGRHLVHIGGWVHLVDDREGETLYSLLKDCQPRRVLLED